MILFETTIPLVNFQTALSVGLITERLYAIDVLYVLVKLLHAHPVLIIPPRLHTDLMMP